MGGADLAAEAGEAGGDVRVLVRVEVVHAVDGDAVALFVGVHHGGVTVVAVHVLDHEVGRDTLVGPGGSARAVAIGGEGRVAAIADDQVAGIASVVHAVEVDAVGVPVVVREGA